MVRSRRALLIFATIAAILPASVVWAGVDSGVQKYQAGDFKGAVAEWEPLAEKGDANAAFNLGQAYRLGRGVSQNLNKAMQYYEQSAKLGHVSAQGNLGTLLYFSAPPVQNRKKAIEWWHTAAQNGDSRAQYMLGILYFNGDDVGKDYAKAYAYTSLSRDSGLAEAKSSYSEISKHLKPSDIENGDRQKERIIAARAATANSAPPALSDAGKSQPVVTWATGPTPALPSNSGAPIATPLPAPPPNNSASLPQIISGTTPAPSSVITPPPSSSGSDDAAPSIVGGGGWRIQLGAFANQQAAEKAWDLTRTKASSTLGDKDPTYEAAGASTRLQISGFTSRDDAYALCSKLKAKGIGCFVRNN